MRSLPSSLAVFAVFFSLLPATPARAGRGTARRVGEVTLFDFIVSMRFEATAEEIASIQRVFTDGNVILSDATDGQFAFGRIELVDGGAAGTEAEVWVEHAGSTQATYGKYGEDGEHIILSYANNCSARPIDPSFPPDAVSDAYTIAHEFAHHVWGLADEYFGYLGDQRVGAKCETLNLPTASFCLMDDFYARGGNSTGQAMNYTLNEFCVHENHDPDHDTYQDQRNHASCWETIAAAGQRYHGVAPSGLPRDTTAPPSPPVFRDPAPERRIAAVIDRSCSMEARDQGPDTASRIELAQQATNLFINLFAPEDRFGLVSFSETARADYPLSFMTPANRSGAIAAVNALAPDSITAIGLGLISGRQLLASVSGEPYSRSILLVTDGFANAGPDELDVLPDLLADGIVVTSVAVGQEVNKENLIALATQTGGRFFQVPSAAELPSLSAFLSAEMTGFSVLARQSGDGQSLGARVARTIHVDPATTELRVVLTTDPSVNLTLSLVAPGGAVLDHAFAAASPDVDDYLSPGTHIFFVRGAAVEAGDWALHVEDTAASGAEFTLTAMSNAKGVYLAASSDIDQYLYPRPVILSATPYYLQPVVDAQVFARVTYPGGGTDLFQLFDDGDESRGDHLAGDGHYAATFTAFRGDGSYRFDVLAEGAEGSTTYEGEALFIRRGDPSNSVPVPPFKRETSLTVVVTGVPLNQPPHADAGTDVRADCASGGGRWVQLDGSASYDRDGSAFTYFWSAPGIVFDDPHAARPSAFFPVGVAQVSLALADASSSSSDTVFVTVTDTEAPEIEVSGQGRVWPADHGYDRIDLAGCRAKIEDRCQGLLSTAAAKTRITCVTSDEPEDAPGGADGHTLADIVIRDATHLDVRRERNEGGNGRVYTINFEVEDASGNVAASACSVGVPRDLSLPPRPVFDDGTAYTVCR